MKLKKTEGNQMSELKLNKMKTKTIKMILSPQNKKSTDNVILSIVRNLFAKNTPKIKKESPKIEQKKIYPIYNVCEIDLDHSFCFSEAPLKSKLAFLKSGCESYFLDLLYIALPSEGTIRRKEILKIWGIPSTTAHHKINIFINNGYLKRIKQGVYRIIDEEPERLQEAN